MPARPSGWGEKTVKWREAACFVYAAELVSCVLTVLGVNFDVFVGTAVWKLSVSLVQASSRAKYVALQLRLHRKHTTSSLQSQSIGLKL